MRHQDFFFICTIQLLHNITHGNINLVENNSHTKITQNDYVLQKGLCPPNPAPAASFLRPAVCLSFKGLCPKPR